MRQLGQLEAAVMERVWAGDRPVLVREVLEDLQQDRPLAYTTVMTVMDNLHKKGFLSRERQGRAYAYRAMRSREEHTAEIMEEVLATAGDRSATLLHFVESISADEMDELKAAIDQMADKRGRS
ncbi:MAG: BlaI/MecI/CopY family transcriptional regulator [Nocardioidaceae bacterium]